MEETTAEPKRVVDARCLPSATTTWLTPKYIIDALGEFDLDPCCPPEMPWRTAKRMISLPEDGLAAEWKGRVWLNPPYGRGIGEWMAKMAGHGQGIALVFARTDAAWFQRHILGTAVGILLLKRRVRFCRPDGTPGGSPAAPSVLAAYSWQDWSDLLAALLPGQLVRLQ